MSIFFVFQGQTFEQEFQGGYVWSPKRAKNGARNIGYTIVSEIRKGDYILHSHDAKIKAISIAKSNCESAEQPSNLRETKSANAWNLDGYKVDCDYIIFEQPLDLSLHRQWLKDNYHEDSPFTKDGIGRQQYMCHLPNLHAEYLLNRAILLQPPNSKACVSLLDIYRFIISEDDYPEEMISQIDEIIGTLDDTPEWPSLRETQSLIITNERSKTLPRRDVQRAAAALARAQFKCEVNTEDRIFLRKNGKGYTEPHHLIPISKYRDYNNSVDVMENIVSLCSHCHNLLHYGRFEDKIPILKKLYKDRHKALKACNIEVSLEKLLEYYK